MMESLLIHLGGLMGFFSCNRGLFILQTMLKSLDADILKLSYFRKGSNMSKPRFKSVGLILVAATSISRNRPHKGLEKFHFDSTLPIGLIECSTGG